MMEEKKKYLLLILGKICAGLIGFVSFLLIVFGPFNSYEQHYVFPSNLQMLGFLGLFICISGFIFINIELFKRTKFEQVLNDEYFESLEVIMEKINSSYLSTIKKKEIKEDLTDIFITAQESGRSVSEVVGNPNNFAIDNITSYGIYRWSLDDFNFGLLAISSSILLYKSIFVILSIFRSTFEPSISFLVPIRMIFFSVVIIFIYMPVLKISQTKKNKYFGYLVPTLIFVIGYLPLVFEPFDWFSHSKLFAFFSREINLIPNVYVLLIYILIIPLAILLRKSLKKKSVSQLLKSGSER